MTPRSSRLIVLSTMLLVESSATDARLLARRIQERIAEHRADDTDESLLRRADQALYQAKEAGRNRIRVAE